MPETAAIAAPPMVRLAFAKQVVKHPQEHVPPHTHAALEVVYVISGRGTSSFAGRKYDLAPHRFCVMPAGVPHDQRNPGGMVTRCLGLEAPTLATSSGAWSDRDGQLGRVLERMLDELEQRPPAWETMVDGLVREAAALITRIAAEHTTAERASDPKRDLVDRALAAIRDSDGQVSVGELSQRLFVSQDYLRHLVHEYTGASPMKHLITMRIGLAAERLRSDPRPVAAVARDCGFDNPYYFSRLFRQVQGCTPTAWRNRT
jgi:AraC-like DNA-binding protein/mannose-6-phosphate isomerase-like protein (cupin superfamily)